MTDVQPLSAAELIHVEFDASQGAMNDWPDGMILGLLATIEADRETIRELKAAREFWDKSYPFDPKSGDQAWKLTWELADGGKVIVNMGREGYENFRKMLLWEATDDAIAAALTSTEAQG